MKRAARLDPRDRELVASIQDGLPLTRRPFAAVAARLRMPESRVIDRIRELLAAGVIKRLGVVVRHHELGYTANAMVVWDVADTVVDALAQRLRSYDFITLCYRRPRRPPHWPYNLYCMIHGRDRTEVAIQIDRLVEELELDDIPREVLFSGRRFKQRGARYGRREVA